MFVAYVLISSPHGFDGNEGCVSLSPAVLDYLFWRLGSAEDFLLVECTVIHMFHCFQNEILHENQFFNDFLIFPWSTKIVNKFFLFSMKITFYVPVFSVKTSSLLSSSNPTAKPDGGLKGLPWWYFFKH